MSNFTIPNYWNILQRKYHFSDVQILPQPTEINSRSEVNLEVSYITKHSKKLINGVPVFVANFDTTGTIGMARAVCSDFFVALSKHVKLEDLKQYWLDTEGYHSFLTFGIGEDEFQRAKDFYNQRNIKNIHYSYHNEDINIVLDVANGYMYKFLDWIKRYRECFPKSIIVAGNVCTPEGVENIIKAGADIVKCGIASGGVCDTKNKAGVGCPQFSVAQECGQAANELEALCMSDGGVKTPADICKALGAGSHFVMAGSLFAGYDECEGEWEKETVLPNQMCESERKKFPNGYLGEFPQPIHTGYTIKKRLRFYGMSSKVANDKYNGGLKEYRASEGKETWVDYKGPVSSLVQDIKGSLASCHSVFFRTAFFFLW
jgi:GMP reductase